jgi:hypothetical protein
MTNDQIIDVFEKVKMPILCPGKLTDEERAQVEDAAQRVKRIVEQAEARQSQQAR